MPPAAKNLPAGLRGPVEVMLSRAAEGIPATTAMSGGTRYQPKFNGWRAVLVRDTPGARLWSRQRVDLSPFPDIIAAAEFHLRPGCVVDGELCVWHDGKLSFDLLQLRGVKRHDPAILAAARAHPASYVAFDLLALHGEDIRASTFTAR